MTGTPIFNQVEDLGALLTFLKAYPFDSASYFGLHISAPLRTNREKALSNLKKLFQCISLRRTKDAVIDELQLTPRFDVIQEVQFNHNERGLYDVLKRSLSYIFRSFASEIDNTGLGSNVLQTITRLRQFCNHGLDILPRNIQISFDGLINQEEINRALLTGPKTCDSCGVQSSTDDLGKDTFRAVRCGHTLCCQCLPEAHIPIQSCPLCTGLEESQDFSISAQDLSNIHHRYEPSSKVVALLKNLSTERKVYPPVKR